MHRQSPQQFLATSWQGDALQVDILRPFSYSSRWSLLLSSICTRKMSCSAQMTHQPLALILHWYDCMRSCTGSLAPSIAWDRTGNLPSVLRFLLQGAVLWQAMAEEPGIRAQEARQEPTGLPLHTLQWVGRSICTTPPHFDLHPEVDALLKSRRCDRPHAAVHAAPGVLITMWVLNTCHTVLQMTMGFAHEALHMPGGLVAGLRLGPFHDSLRGYWRELKS